MGVIGFSAPIIGPDHTFLGGVGLYLPDARYKSEERQKYIDTVKTCASGNLFHREPEPWSRIKGHKIMAYKRGLILNPEDNVANVLEEVLPGDTIQLSLGDEIITINVEEHIPFGFKVAAKDIHCNTPIIKYGQQIGLANRDIQQGDPRPYT